MIDGLVSGLLGGMLADPLGNYLSRFHYRTAFLGGISLAFIMVACFVISIGLYDAFIVGKEGVLDKIFSPGTLLFLTSMSLLSGVLGVVMKACAPLLTWKEAETILLNDGYARTVSEKGDVAFEKEKVLFVARNGENLVPERIECWNKGIRKLDVVLRPRPKNKVAAGTRWGG